MEPQRKITVNDVSLHADIQDRTIARGFSNHERTRIDTKKWSDSRPLASIRGSFFSLLVGATPRRDLCSADIQDRTTGRGFSNHEWTRIDTKKWSDSRPLASIRGSFFPLLVGVTLRCSIVIELRAFSRGFLSGARGFTTSFRRYAHTPTRSPSVVAATPRCDPCVLSRLSSNAVPEVSRYKI